MLTCLVLVALALPAAVAAHAELESTSPEAGSTVATSPATVTATFSEALEAGKSSIEVVVPGGASVATGGVAADDPTTLLVELPALAPGSYRVRWTASSDDGHLERGSFDFTVAEAPSPEPTVDETEAPSLVPTAAPSATQTVSAGPTDEPAASPTPSPAPDSSGGGSESVGQLLVIAVAGIGVGIGIGWWRSRRAG
jgi:methionine-rich copper-binding protein CopC